MALPLKPRERKKAKRKGMEKSGLKTSIRVDGTFKEPGRLDN